MVVVQQELSLPMLILRVMFIPVSFWQDYSVGNVREKSFSQIWTSEDELMVKLREKDKHLTGKCGQCQYKTLCRMSYQSPAVHGDLWAADPACYLSEEEIQG